jgi:hypothetical protein
MAEQINTTITIQDTVITVVKINSDDYISLTDMAKLKNAEIPATVISHWMSTNYTMNFMGVWEKMHNDSFNLTGFREVKMMSTETGFALSPKQWIERTNALTIVFIPMLSKSESFHRKSLKLKQVSSMLVRQTC